jgi:hypothetical protein
VRSEAARTLWSIWSWFALGVIVLVWTPMVAVVRAVTMPFDRGAWAAGYLFRKLTVVHQRLTPLGTTTRASSTSCSSPISRPR